MFAVQAHRRRSHFRSVRIALVIGGNEQRKAGAAVIGVRARRTLCQPVREAIPAAKIKKQRETVVGASAL